MNPIRFPDSFRGAIQAVLLSVALSAGGHEGWAEPTDPIRALLVTGGCCHDYARQKEILTEGIADRARVEWRVVQQGGDATDARIQLYEDPDWAAGFDVVVHNECFAGVEDEAWVERILAPHRNRIPAVLLHCAMHSYRIESEAWFRFCGVTSHRHGDHYPYEVVNQAPSHPILQGWGKSWETPAGELYLVEEVAPTATPLAHAWSRDTEQTEVCVWVNDYEGTPVFGTTIGHHNETMASGPYLDLVTRGLLWATGKLDEDHLKESKGPEEKVEKVRENLARDRPATAAGHQAGRPPEAAVDGNPGTRWCAPDDETGYWWQVDLQQPETLIGLRIRWEFENRYQYRVEGSPDGEDWSLLVDATDREDPSRIHEHDVDADGVRWVRITVTGLEEGSWASFYELEVLGTERVKATPQRQRQQEALLGQTGVVDGFEKTLFAAPPDVVYPACLTAKPNGDLFVGVDRNGSLDTEPYRGRILLIRDTGEDGRADTSVVFADNVDSPRGLVYDGRTLYVMHPPKLTAFRDRDGDGVADESTELVDGLGFDLDFRGADHTTNGIQMGVDGWIYIAVGDYGFIEARGSDGTTLSLLGGGVVRVRPDGSEMDLHARGTRNIYDVAIDPYLNLFARDNTNDGDGWDVRLHHLIANAEYGYPSLYRHFHDEIIPPLADYGGGSGTGALYVDEPGLPEGYGETLYTADWGRNAFYRHPLEPNGATFEPGQEEFVEMPRPIDLTVDGRSRLYLASWHNGGFNYSGEDVGYIVRLAPTDTAERAFPKIHEASDSRLVRWLTSGSDRTRRAAQREILRRAETDPQTRAFARAVRKVIFGPYPLDTRVAAIFTLKQLRGAASHATLLDLEPTDVAYPWALRAVADRKSQIADVPIDPFIEALSAESPRLRREALIGLGRLGRPEAADAILPQTASADPVIRHIAVRSLVALEAVEACLQAVDEARPKVAAGALEALRQIHQPGVVDGLMARVDRSDLPEARQREIVVALMRLHYQEAPYEGDWWGTRPDPHGPYYNPISWRATERIARFLNVRLKNADPEDAAFLVEAMERHQIEPELPLEEWIELVNSLEDPSSPAVDWMLEHPDLDGRAVPLLERLAQSPDLGAERRAATIESLLDIGGTAAFEAASQAVVGFGPLDEMDEAWLEPIKRFASDPRHRHDWDEVTGWLESEDPARRDVAYAVLLTLASEEGGWETLGDEASRALAHAWDQPESRARLLRLIGRLRLSHYADQVRLHQENSNAAVREAARFAANRLQIDLDSGSEGSETADAMVGELSYEQVLLRVVETQGDPEVGETLFQQQACVACHTVAEEQAPRGPDLSDIATRYNRRELTESILRPNATIAQGFATHAFELAEGGRHEGFVTREGAEEIEIRNVAGVPTTIDKDAIVERWEEKLSMMPQGLVDNLTLQELASLLAYLEGLAP